MDAELDPYTRDLTGQRINTLANAVYIRLITPLGSWWADSSLGSRLHELQRSKDLPHISKLAQQYAEDALAPLLADGRASRIDVTTEQPHNGRLLLLVEVTDVTGQTQVFKHLVRLV